MNENNPNKPKVNNQASAAAIMALGKGLSVLSSILVVVIIITAVAQQFVFGHNFVIDIFKHINSKPAAESELIIHYETLDPFCQQKSKCRV